MKKYLLLVEYRVTAKNMKEAIGKIEGKVRLLKLPKDIEYRYIKDVKVEIPKIDRFSATSN